MPIIASNFKTNHTRKSTKEYIEQLNKHLLVKDITTEVLVFPTSSSFNNFSTIKSLQIGAQNAYAVDSGSFTGEIGLTQLDEFDIKTILIGHSERRHILNESQEQIAKKYDYFKQHGFKIVYCIGEPLEVKEQGLEKTLEYLFEQFVGIDTNYENLILAYEPVWAIGTGVSATAKDIEEIHQAIKERISKPLLYGGSVKVENIRDICKIKNVDGALIGTASWKIEDFIQIIENVKDL